MNFWERNNYNGQNVGSNKNSNNGSANTAGNSGCTEQDVRDRMSQYGGKSEEQLMSELTAMAARMKSEGTFDPSAMENLFATASPLLNEEQRKRMRAIIDMLKG